MSLYFLLFPSIFCLFPIHLLLFLSIFFCFLIYLLLFPSISVNGTEYSLRLGHAAVDRAAVDRAVDLARTLLSGAQGPGPRDRDPIGP